MKQRKNFARYKEDMTWKIVAYQAYIRNTTGIKTVMQTWQYIGGVEMLYKKVAGFEDYDILEPAIKEIDIMNFQNKTEKECVDVPFTIVGKEKETEEWLNERWMIANMKYVSQQNMSYYEGALKALEFAGYDWKRDAEGKHTLYKNS